jgi:hypothetical protein
MPFVPDPGTDPAFPPPGGGNKQGVTVRDYFAAHAIVGLCANVARMNQPGAAQSIAEEAYQLADAAVEARKR